MAARICALLALAVHANAYAIDFFSCSDPNVQSLLQDSIPAAFALVNDAITATRNPSPAVQNLMNYLWASGGNNVVTPQQAILARFAGDPVPIGAVGYQVFEYAGYGASSLQPIRGIQSYQNSDMNRLDSSGISQIGGDEVIFFCDTSRFQDATDPVTRRQVVKDTQTLQADRNTLPGSSDDPRRQCRSALAWTMIPKDPSKASQVNLCPWFIQWRAGLRNPTSSSFRTYLLAAIAKPAISLTTSVWPYTTMDLLSLFPKVVVHELTHTRHGGNTDDCTFDGSGSFGTLLQNVGYGWKNCRLFSTRTPDNGMSANQLPINNADSYALYATGVSLINKGFTINADGSVRKPNQSSNSKRSVEDEIVFGAEFDDFDEDVVPQVMWSAEFNSTVFPETEGLELSEDQKNALVNMLFAGWKEYQEGREDAHNHEHNHGHAHTH